ncbi:MAG: CHAP domain-containing protein [Streptococcaceae bacterium]|nr:CHAP domain-containing protein [Streptococcaceae bacterium]
MKKRIISAILLSTVVLSAAAPVSGVYADTNSDIQKQDATIASAQSAKTQAQAQVDTIQSKIDSLKAKQSDVKQKMAKLEAEGKKLNAQVATLRQNISERDDSLKAQARSAQVNNSATSYLDAVVSSKSLTDAIQKITAMATVTSANKDMIVQQQKDMKAVQEKQAENQKNDGIMVAAANSLAQQSRDLADQQAQLKVAQINYQLTITSAQGKKAQLQAQKAAAEEAAAAQAAKQQAAAAKVASANAAPIVQVPQTPSTSNTGGGSSSSSNTGSNSNSGSNTNNNSNNNNNSNSNGGGTSGGYYIPPHNYGSSPSTYVAPTCTYYVKSVFGNRVGDYWGNGADWAASARADGFTVDSNPVAGSTVAVFGPNVRGGSYGHVAVVQSVNKAAGTMVIGEAIDLGNGYFNTTNTVKISDANYGFIHV